MDSSGDGRVDRPHPVFVLVPGGPDDRVVPTGGNREAINAAARRLFAEKGYQGVSVRAIAREAEVDPALVHYFHSTKDELFVAMIAKICDLQGLTDRVLRGERDGLATELVRAFLDLWELPRYREPLLAILRSAVNHDEAYRVLYRFTTTGFVRDVAVASGASEPELRAELIVAQLMGVIMMRDVLGFKLLAAVDREVLVTQLAFAVDLLLTCDLSLFTR
jgi:AcrR family transcriptional regulator